MKKGRSLRLAILLFCAALVCIGTFPVFLTNSWNEFQYRIVKPFLLGTPQNADEEYTMGLHYRYGEADEIDYAEAFKWFKKAADKNHASAQQAVGQAYISGKGVTRNVDKGIEYLVRSGEQNNPKAQKTLFYLYEDGSDTIEKNPAMALYWLQKLAAHGNPYHIYSLGLAYGFGKGVPEDKRKAFPLYLKAAMSGLGIAQYAVATAYYKGQGIDKDDNKAFEWYLKAAEQGNGNAQIWVGYAYSKGLGTYQNDAEAFKWYMKAAENKKKDAYRFVAYAYEAGKGVNKDPLKALEWYHKAAKAGEKTALYRIGRLYEKGEYPLKADMAKAVDFYIQGAKKKEPDSEYALGDVLMKGLGVPKDEIKGFHFFQRAAEHGDKYAQHKMGYFYLTGTGTTRNDQEAYFWIKVASLNGNSETAENLRIATRRLTPQDVTVLSKRAQEWVDRKK